MNDIEHETALEKAERLMREASDLSAEMSKDTKKWGRMDVYDRTLASARLVELRDKHRENGR